MNEWMEKLCAALWKAIGGAKEKWQVREAGERSNV